MEETNYVYILRSGKSNNFKIGVAKNIENRIKQLQTGSPYRLTTYHYFEAPTRALAFNCEHILHKFFDGHKTKLMCGEWYQIELKELRPLLDFMYTNEVISYCMYNWGDRTKPYATREKKNAILEEW